MKKGIITIILFILLLNFVKPTLAACKDNGETCGSYTECCSGHCLALKCSGTGNNGDNCLNNYDCKSNYCLNNKCEVKPVSNSNYTTVKLSGLLDALGVMGFKFSGSNANLGSILTSLLPYFYAFAGTGLLMLLIFGGFKYLTSAGDPKKTESAKGTITAAIIGFLIVIAAFWITQIANYVFGLGVNVP